MFKFSFLLVFSLLFYHNEALNQLCSVRKAEKNCICKRITDSEDLIATEADCVRTNFDYFPTSEQLPKDLNLLDLSHNSLTKLDATETRFSSVTLETLKLSYNAISFISYGFFAEIPNLRILVLSHNNIESLDSDEIFQKNPKITHLDLSFNFIHVIQAATFSPLVELQVLDLSYNNHSLGESLSQVRTLTDSGLGINPNIVRLSLDNIGLKDVQNGFFSNHTYLTHLSLADNRFTQVPRVPYSVEYLDLSGTDISVLQAKELSYHTLRVLRLERMKMLETIHHYAFYNLEALEELSVKHCRNLREFNELVFGALQKNEETNLRKLSLAGNGLQSLNWTYKYLFRSLDFIDLTDNPWKCDCDILWLQEFENLYKSENVKCSSPLSLRSKQLFDVTDENVPTCYPQKYGKKSHRVLIAFLILLVLILAALVGYLFYYSPSWWSGNRSRGIGPQSPYSASRIGEELT
ncbi:chondroadherin [Tribolium castaneum]|uniref:Chondroadherin-like Protein n=1 Tax=Tribolium castaneum TaxID=7070 RepID=D6WAP9_TRICA|nr:PREDICTED: chondroadherin [Tribolium castaneum]EEZ97968.1 Chondroadherin-like Protein [Tribolium castaneum]|eukprot:XP_975147.1 PREDICTED: chondroadherin [Tribolium castaneum]